MSHPGEKLGGKDYKDHEDSYFSIKITDLKKTLGKNEALKGVSLDFEPAKMHGIIGPEGAGKTTLMRIIVGLLKPNAGKVEFYQEKQSLPFEKVRTEIAYMPQSQSLYADLSVDEHLVFFKSMYQINEKDYQKRREELLDITRLGPFVNRTASQLSGGMYKKLGLMCSLLRHPKIMLLDEPTNGVDPISRREFWDLLYRLLDTNILILVSTAYMDEAERCSVVHLLEAGKMISSGEPEQLLAESEAKNFDEIFMRHGKEMK